MEKYFNTLRKTGLFEGVERENIEPLLGCLGARVKSVRRGDTLLRAGDTPGFVGVVLDGRLNIGREDADGNRALIASVSPGEIFAEALCCARVAESPVSVVAGCDGEVMHIPFERVLRQCARSCPFHARLIENMLGLIARKNLELQRRMDIISQKSIRERVLRYLEPLVKRRGGTVTLPFNREEMADFLCVERSALSHELSRMKKEGLIDYERRQFTLK